MEFTCPNCRLASEGEGLSPGQIVACPYCGEEFSIPAGVGTDMSAAEASRQSAGFDNGEPPIVITPIRTGDSSDSTPSSTAGSTSHPHPNPNRSFRIQRGAVAAAHASPEVSSSRRRRWPAVVGIVVVLAIAGAGAWFGGVFGHRGGGSPDSPSTPATGATTTRQTPPTTTRDAPLATTRPPKTFSGPRAHVKRYIDSHGDTCRVVSLTKTGGDVVVCNRNDWASSGCPKAMTDVLDYIVALGSRITDVTVTEEGHWLVLYDRNSARWSNIPYRMEQVLREYNRNNEELYSATFNDAGDWIIITDKHYHSSAGFITDWLRDGERQFGELRSACICGGDAVAVFNRGFLFWGNVPYDLKKALRETLLNVRIIKIAGKAWFFSDAHGFYQYNM